MCTFEHLTINKSLKESLTLDHVLIVILATIQSAPQHSSPDVKSRFLYLISLRNARENNAGSNESEIFLSLKCAIFTRYMLWSCCKSVIDFYTRDVIFLLLEIPWIHVTDFVFKSYQIQPHFLIVINFKKYLVNNFVIYYSCSFNSVTTEREDKNASC